MKKKSALFITCLVLGNNLFAGYSNDMANLKGRNYCHQQINTYSYTHSVESDETIAKKYAAEYIKDEPSMAPYESDWIQGCLYGLRK